MLSRTFSKAKAVGNHVVWSGRETIPVPYLLPGVPANGQEFAWLRVTGKPMFLHGYRVDFQVPSGSSRVECYTTLYTGSGIALENSTLYLNGVVAGADKIINPPIAMPINSLWKMRVFIQIYDGQETFYPEGLSLTYHLRYATGPVHARLFSTAEGQEGVGFDQVGETLIVQ